MMRDLCARGETSEGRWPEANAGGKPRDIWDPFRGGMIFAQVNRSNRGMSEGAESALAYLSFPLNVPEPTDQRE